MVKYIKDDEIHISVALTLLLEQAKAFGFLFSCFDHYGYYQYQLSRMPKKESCP